MSVVLTVLLILAPVAAGRDTCRECHAVLDGPLAKPALEFARDVHARVGFGCASCHGGDPTQEDPALSMSRAKGFVGKITRTAIPRTCARCHSDAALMHKFKPQQRVDQLAQYLTSVHGKRLAQGDSAVATCTDCHGTHGILEVRDAQAPTHPLRLPTTCGRCHADARLMARYGLPTNQLAEYQASVHWEALSRRRDLSAPNCATCHGNHGATPPEVSSVAAVCGTCHALLEELFRKSVHQPLFATMPRGGCSVCHGHHRVQRTTVDMLDGAGAVCAQCHEPGSSGARVAAEMGRRIRELKAALDRSDQILARAARDGMEVSEAVLRQQEGREALVKARVAVHTANLEEVLAWTNQGMAVAQTTWRAGQEALRERDRRRMGLAVSLCAIALAIAGLWLKLRSVEANRPGW